MDNIWIHKETGNKYKVISDNARMKDMTMPDRWVDCVIYSPMYDNQYEMFSRWKSDFYDKFEPFNGLTDEELEEQRKIRRELRERWEKLGLTSEMQDKLEEYTKSFMGEAKKEDGEIKWPIIERVFIDFNKKYKIPEETVAEKIDQLWHEYYKCCDGCVGSGCDDCRGCEEAERKYEIYKEIKSLTNNEN